MMANNIPFGGSISTNGRIDNIITWYYLMNWQYILACSNHICCILSKSCLKILPMCLSVISTALPSSSALHYATQPFWLLHHDPPPPTVLHRCAVKCCDVMRTSVFGQGEAEEQKIVVCWWMIRVSEGYPEVNGCFRSVPEYRWTWGKGGYCIQHVGFGTDNVMDSTADADRRRGWDRTRRTDRLWQDREQEVEQ